MKRAVVAGFAAGIAMAIGAALGSVASGDPRPTMADAGGDAANPMIGGQVMAPDRDIMTNMTASPLHTSFVAALRESGVAGALKSNGQFTVFAPTNAALAARRDSSKSGLARRMSYLIVPGAYDSQALLRVISQAGGEARLRTAEGGVLVARMNGPTNIVLMDERGNVADIAVYDVRDKNGIIHVVDRDLEPSGPTRQMAAN